MILRVFLMIAVCALTVTAVAAEPGRSSAAATADAPGAREAVARTLESELIAPCCWSQQVSVHSSPAADAVRRDIRELLASGRSHDQIVDAYVARYGTRILAVPPNRGFSSLLHAWPWLAGLGSVLVLVWVLRVITPRPRAAMARAAGPPISAAEAERLESELRDVD